MQDFAAIDFETANNERSSVCSVGVVIVRDGEMVYKFYSLIKPEPKYYNFWCSRVHGLCAESCLKAVFRVYQMDYPDYPFLCTCVASRKVWPGGSHSLDVIAARFGYDLSNHHHALADAEACAAIALQIL